MDSFRTQGSGRTHQINQIPAGIAVAILPRVRVLQMAVERVAHKLIIKTQAVVA